MITLVVDNTASCGRKFLDKVEIAAARVGLVYLARVAESLGDAMHNAALAESCSDICAMNALEDRIMAAQASIDFLMSYVKGQISQAKRK